MNKPAVTSAQLMEAIKERWSPVAFDTEAEISAESLNNIFEAARWAPSCFNAQPWRFLAFGRQDQGRKALEGALVEGNHWAKQASHLVVVAAQEAFTHNDKPNRHHGYDAGAAVLSLVLQAQSEGIASHQMGGFNQEAVREAFAIPSGIAIFAVIALGAEVQDLEGLSEALIERQKAPRSRLELNQILKVGSNWDF